MIAVNMPCYGMAGCPDSSGRLQLTETKIPLNDLRRGFLEQANDIERALADVARGGWYIHGPQHTQFEEEFAAFLGTRHAIGVASGTDALMLALASVARDQSGDVVVAANAGGYATVAARQVGLQPVYADVDAETLCLDARSVESVIDAKTVAVVVTHLYGRMADMDSLLAVCEPIGVPIIEDCAQAAGARTTRGLAGTHGTLGVFSFYPTKNLGALGDGGAVVTDDEQLAQHVRSLRQYGWSSKCSIEHVGGRNSRLDEIQAAILRLRLPLLDGWNDRRRAIIRAYASAATSDRVAVLAAEDVAHAAHLAVMLTDDRVAARRHLSRYGIASDIHFPIPDYRQVAFAPQLQAGLAVTDWACDRVLSLPCFPQMTDGEIMRVREALHEF